MNLIRRAILALTLMAGLAPAFAQAPPPVPALPDTERRTTYSISGTTCACSVGFALYGDTTDYGNWLEVFVNGVLQSSSTYTITSPTGPLASIARPITDGVLTFNAATTGTVQIVGARRPRRAVQFSENRGVAARDLNQAVTDIVAMLREDWDKINDVTGRAVLAAPGETLALLPAATTRKNQGACFDNSGNLTNCVSVPTSTFTAGNGILFSGVNPTTITNNITAGANITITGTNPLSIGQTAIASPNVMANVSGSSAAPSATSPQAFNQGGFTGMAPCGFMLADNMGMTFPAGVPSTTQMIINQVTEIVLCQASTWVTAAWAPDPTQVKVMNIIGSGVFSTTHLTFDITGQAGVGSCSATGVSDETHIGCNDVSSPCHVASTPKDCIIFIVAKTSTPGTINDIGLVGSSRSGTSGPSAAVQAVYPYYAPYAWNRTTGQTTFAGETLRWYLARIGAIYTILGDTSVGFGKYTAVASGTTASAFTGIAIPAGFTSPDTKNISFSIVNTGTSSSLCGVAPYSTWTTGQLNWPNNPGLTNLVVPTPLWGTAGQYGYVSSVAGCSVYINSFSDSFAGTP